MFRWLLYCKGKSFFFKRRFKSYELRLGEVADDVECEAVYLERSDTDNQLRTYPTAGEEVNVEVEVDPPAGIQERILKHIILKNS